MPIWDNIFFKVQTQGDSSPNPPLHPPPNLPIPTINFVAGGGGGGGGKKDRERREKQKHIYRKQQLFTAFSAHKAAWKMIKAYIQS